MVTEELLRYVEYQSNRGVDRNSIKMTLLQNGWAGDDITEAFKIVDTVTSAEAQLANQPSSPESQPVVTNTQPQTQVNQPNQPVDNRGQSGPSQPGLGTTHQYSNQSQPAQVVADQSANSNYSDSAQLNQANQYTSQGTTSQDLPGSVQSTGQPIGNQSQPSIDPITVNESLKYRTAEDWQTNRPPVETAQQPTPNPSGVYMQSTTGQVIATNQNQAIVQPNQSNPVMTQPIAASPRTALQQNKPKNSGVKKGILIGLIVVVLAALGYVGYYFFAHQDSPPTYDLSDVISAMKSQNYIIFNADTALPVATESIGPTAPPAIQRLDQPQVSFSTKGLIDPLAGKTGFEIVVGQAKFDYVYDGNSSYGRIRELPDDLKGEFIDSMNKWFNFSDPNDTRVVQQFFTNNPGNSMTDTGSALGTALVDLYQSGNIELVYLDSYELDGEMVDRFDFFLDIRQLLSRLGPEASLISSIISHLDIATLQGIATINHESMLLQSIEAELTPTSTLIADFSYNYQGAQQITAPSETSSVTEILVPLQSINQFSVIAKIRATLRTIGSNASVYFSENQSYAGFCDSEVVQTSVTTIADFSGNLPFCNSVSAGFAFQVKLPNTDHFACIDNDLVDQATLTPLGQATACGEAVQYPTAVTVESVEVESTTNTQNQQSLESESTTGEPGQYFE